jgi:bifunctional DNA-binding transcriptional regulator/antitoxin component of YhaV-PrlF toxin-antitoxin module
MEVTIDAGGRLMIPRSIRTRLGLLPGTKADISIYGAGAQITAGPRTARVVRENGRLVLDGPHEITDDVLYSLIDAGRK